MKIVDVNLLHISYSLHYIVHVCILDYCITIIYLCVMGKQTRKMWWYQTTQQTQKFHFFRVTTLINIQGGGWGHYNRNPNYVFVPLQDDWKWLREFYLESVKKDMQVFIHLDDFVNIAYSLSYASTYFCNSTVIHYQAYKL